MREVVCPTCGDLPQELIGLRGGRHQRYGLGVETRVVRCSGCSLLFCNPFPFPVRPLELYGDPSKYFEHHALDRKIAYYRALVRTLIRRSGRRGPRVLDVGAGRGDFLHACTLEGLQDVRGLEFSTAMIETAREEFGVELLAQSVEDFAASRPGQFDAVVLNAVLEHVYDPSSFMAAVALISKPGAVLYIDVPNEPNLLTHVANAAARLRGSETVYNLQPTWSPYHVYGFNTRALDALLRKHGFVLESSRAWALPQVPTTDDIIDRMRGFAGALVMHTGNVLGMGSNLFAWARRSG